MGATEEENATPWFSRKPKQFTVKELGRRILNGSFGLVGFQRDSVWEPQSGNKKLLGDILGVFYVLFRVVVFSSILDDFRA